MYHNLFNWDSIFSKLRLDYDPRKFHHYLSISIFSIWVFLIGFQWYLIQTRHFSNLNNLAIGLVIVGLVGLIFSTRIWFLERRFYLGAMESLHEIFLQFSPDDTPRKYLAPHSSPIIAQVEIAFNELLDTLRSYEKQLSQWVIHQSQKSRNRATGELASLVIHDLGSPLHVLCYLTQSLKEDLPKETDRTQHLENISTNMDRCIELIDSLSIYLKNPSKQKMVCDFEITHLHVMNLIHTQFLKNKMETVRFVMDKKLNPLKLRIRPTDLVHVLVNLFSNSLENFFSHSISKPQIELKLVTLDQKRVIISFQDNGTGLNVKDFESLTSFPSSASYGKRMEKRGLGLKLVCRMLESYDGSLTPQPQPQTKRGTLFHLEIPPVPSSLQSQEKPIAHSQRSRVKEDVLPLGI